MLTKQDEQKIEDIVLKVIKDVILPVFETVALKADLKKVATKEDLKKLATKKELEAVKDRVFQIDQKVDRILDRQMIHDVKIKKLENAVTAT